MSGNSLLLDTNIVLYLLSGDDALSDILHRRKLYVSFITQLELLSYPGITADQEDRIKDFLEDCIIVDVNDQIKDQVISIKRVRKMKLPDCIILATANYLDIPVITSDKYFSTVENANVIYYEF